MLSGLPEKRHPAFVLMVFEEFRQEMAMIPWVAPEEVQQYVHFVCVYLRERLKETDRELRSV